MTPPKKSEIPNNYFSRISRAIIESGGATPVSPTQKYATREAANADGAKFLQIVGCADIACAKQLSFSAIVNASMQIVASGQPVLIEGSFFETLASGEFHDVPLIIGDTLNELNFMPFSYFPTPVGPDGYADALSKLLQGVNCRFPKGFFEWKSRRGGFCFRETRFFVSRNNPIFYL
jgi:hypothetical protein